MTYLAAPTLRPLSLPRLTGFLRRKETIDARPTAAPVPEALRDDLGLTLRRTSDPDPRAALAEAARYPRNG